MTDSHAVARPLSAVAQCVSSAKRVLAATHMNPDGDAIGSLSALGHIAATLGIDVRLYCETIVPSHLDWLNYPVPLVTNLAALGDWRPDCLILLDCADENRAGAEMAAFTTACREGNATCDGITTVCIDHHIANPHFAALNWVDPSMSATGVMVALLAKELGQPLAGDLGEALYFAIVSDTGSFSYANTTALAMELAAEIVKNGLSVADFTIKYENNWALGRMHLWGSLMGEVQVLCDGKLVVSVVTDEHLLRYGCKRTDLEGYASWLRRLAGTKVVLLARPSRNGSKISLRSMGDVDVQEIAAELGGGGHKGASGADMAEKPRAAADLALKAVCKALGCAGCALAEHPLR
ncbi:DHH family phosphoesterase [Desulfovibrio sp. OttesenSCG-928-O18]|nr:DHH family phosphoesterase [Desulfovibrio sp. OttesenSCG-928-O18]